jgi:hypothetical protein
VAEPSRLSSLLAEVERKAGARFRPITLAAWSAGCGALRELSLRRRAVARWGPMGTVLLSDTRAGRLRVQGFAGNSAPDHVDLLRALPEWLRARE